MMDAIAGIVLILGVFAIVLVCVFGFDTKANRARRERRLARRRGSFDGNRLAQSVVDVLITDMWMR